jgi:inorganic triphosphatase YgiF
MTAAPTTEEIELKLVVAPERLAALRQALRAGSVRTERLQAIYFDTADERLGRAGAALRLRREGRRWVQTLKVGTHDALRRLEHNADVPAPAKGEQPVLVVERHAGTPAGDALDRIAAGEALELVPRFRTDVRRTLRAMRVAGARLEVALDVGAVVAASGVEAIHELELELKSGPVAGMLQAALRWLEPHGLWIGTVTKAERGARLARGEAPAAVGARAPHVDEHVDAAGFFVAAVRSALDHALPNLALLAEGAADDAIVHQARVGVRRLRTALREMAALEPRAVDPSWELALRGAFLALGRHRDTDVVLPAVRARLPVAGVPVFADPPLPDAPEPLVDIARERGLQRVLLDLLGLVHRPAADALPSLAGQPARRVVSDRLEALHAQLLRDARRYADLDVTRQHRVRKRLKRLRYLSEFAAPLFGAKRVGKYLAHWRSAQDALGMANDDRIAAEAWRRHAEHDPAAWFAVGWLTARDDDAVHECRRALRRAAKTKAFWAG